MKPVSTLASATVYYLYLFLLSPHSLMPGDTGRRAVVSFTGAVEDLFWLGPRLIAQLFSLLFDG